MDTRSEATSLKQVRVIKTPEECRASFMAYIKNEIARILQEEAEQACAA